MQMQYLFQVASKWEKVGAQTLLLLPYHTHGVTHSVWRMSIAD